MGTCVIGFTSSAHFCISLPLSLTHDFWHGPLGWKKSRYEGTYVKKSCEKIEIRCFLQVMHERGWGRVGRQSLMLLCSWLKIKPCRVVLLTPTIQYLQNYFNTFPDKRMTYIQVAVLPCWNSILNTKFSIPLQLSQVSHINLAWRGQNLYTTGLRAAGPAVSEWTEGEV